LGVKVMEELVKESVPPAAEKKPLMESAWATALLLIARAEITTSSLNIWVLRVEDWQARSFPRAD
jgi:hypothetical protein